MLRLQGIQKSFTVRGKNQKILHDITCTVGDKEIIAILGPNGAGKTTLLKIISGLDHPDSGTMRWKNAIPRHVGLVPQDTRNSLFPWQTVTQHLDFSLENQKINNAKERREYLLQLLGLTAHRTKYPYELSGGFVQLLAIGRALALNPSILLLDEPFSALDYHTRIAIHERLLSIHTALHILIIIITHSLDEAIILADRLLILTAAPATIAKDITITLPRPRVFSQRNSAAFSQIRHETLTTLQGFLSHQL